MTAGSSAVRVPGCAPAAVGGPAPSAAPRAKIVGESRNGGLRRELVISLNAAENGECDEAVDLRRRLLQLGVRVLGMALPLSQAAGEEEPQAVKRKGLETQGGAAAPGLGPTGSPVRSRPRF